MLAALGLLGLLMAACTSSSTRQPSVMRLPLYGNLHQLDPVLASTPSDIYVASLLNAGLMKMAPDLHIIPDLAVSIPTISSGGRSYTFTIRQDARFADGRSCTAQDVAHSLARALRPELHSPLARQYLGNIVGARAVETGQTNRLAGVKVLDRLTVRIRLRRPDSTFLQKLAFPVASIVEVPTHSKPPPGAGPFMLGRRQKDGSLRLGPRPYYYGGPLQLKGLDLVPVKNYSTALDLYRKGSLDVARVPLSDWKKISSHNDFHQASSLDAYYALPPAQYGRELAATLDRTRLIQNSTDALSSLSSIVPPVVPDYEASPPGVDPPGGQVSALKARGVDLQSATPRNEEIRLLRGALSRQWKVGGKRGIPIKLIHAYYMLPDPSVWLHLVLPQTHSGWFRRVLRRASTLTFDPVTRMSAYSVEENWAIVQGLIIPLAAGNNGYLIKAQAEGLQVTPLGILPDNNNWASVNVG